MGPTAFFRKGIWLTLAHLYVRVKNVSCIATLAVLTGFSVGCDGAGDKVASGVIFGTVINSETSEPVEGVNVTVRPNTEKVTTGSDGQFRFADFPGGSYTLEFAKDGYQTDKTNVTLSGSGKARADMQLIPVDQSLVVSRQILDFGAERESRSFDLSVDKGTAVEFEVVENLTWLTCDPTSGQADKSHKSVDSQHAIEKNSDSQRGESPASSEQVPLQVLKNPEEKTPGGRAVRSGDSTETPQQKTIGIVCTVDREGLKPDTYEGTIVIRSDNAGTAELTVRMEVLGPELSVSTHELDFGTDRSQESFSIRNATETGTFRYIIDPDTSVLIASPSDGRIVDAEEDVIQVDLDRTSLAPDNYRQVIVVDGGETAGTEQIDVLFTVIDPDSPQLTISRSRVDFGTEQDETDLRITNTGTGTLNWRVEGANESWYAMSQSGGQLRAGETAVVAVTVSRRNQSSGNYSDAVSFTSEEGGSQSFEIRMVVPPEPILAVSRDSLDFKHDRERLSFTISNDGNGTLKCDLGPTESWIDVNPDSTVGLTDVNVEVTREGTGFGDHVGKVQINCNGGDDQVLVLMVHREPNEPPTARFDIAPDPAYLDTVVTVDASASDDDYTAREKLDLRVRWTKDGSFSSWETDKIWTHEYITEGQKSITVEVRDEEGLVGRVTKSVDMMKNEPPSVTLSVFPEEGGTTTTFDFEADATDDITPEEDLEYRWRAKKDEEDWSSWSFSSMWSHRYIVSGEYTTLVQARDQQNNVAVDSVVVSVVGDDEPNDSRNQATLISPDAAVDGQVCSSADGDDNPDWFRIELESNGLYRFMLSMGGSGELKLALSHDEKILSSITVDSFNWTTGIGFEGETDFVAVYKGGVYYLKMEQKYGNECASYDIQGEFREVDQTDLGEVNNSIGKAHVISDTTSFNAVVGFGEDTVDWYRFTATSDTSLSFRAENLQRNGTSVGSLKRVRLYAASDTTEVLASAPEHFRLDAGEVASAESIQLQKGQDYLLKVQPDTREDAAPYQIELWQE